MAYSADCSMCWPLKRRVVISRLLSLSWALCMLRAFSVLQPLVDGVAFAALKMTSEMASEHCGVRVEFCGFC